MRVQFLDQNTSSNQYQVSDDFLSPDYVSQSKQDKLNFKNMFANFFDIEMSESIERIGNKSAFGLEAFRMIPSTDPENPEGFKDVFLSTVD